MKTVLTVLAGAAAGQSLEVQPGQTVGVGRTSKSQFVLAGDEYLSRVHFVLEYGPGGCRLKNSSANGTVVSGARVEEAVLRDGDIIAAGQTMFAVEVEESGPPLHILQRQALPVLAILDAARDGGIPGLIAESGEQHQSLLEGEQGRALAQVAPYLVALPPASPLLQTLAAQHWGRSTCLYLTSRLPLSELCRHFRQFLLVKPPQGDPSFFRFYDPRVLRVFLPTCTPPEAGRFFGAVRSFLVEAENPRLLLRFTCGAEGTIQTQLNLTS
jgi:predicted component of type VI protein secretion system